MRGFWTVIALALVAGLGVPASAQEPPTHSVRVPRVVPAGPGRLALYVSVTDGNVDPVPGLIGDDFSFVLESTPMTVRSASTLHSLGEGLAISFLIDSSDSLPITEHELREVAAAFVNKRHPQDVLAVGTLDDEARGPARVWTGASASLERWVQTLAPTKQTLLYEAVGKGLARLRAPTDLPAMRAVVVLTDGVDFGSRDPWTSDAARDGARDAGLPVFSIWYASKDAKSRSQGVEVMRALAVASSGQVHMATDAQGAAASKSEIEAAFDAFYASAHGIYMVEVESGALALGRYTGQLTVSGAPPIRFPFELAAAVPPSVVVPTPEPPPEVADAADDADEGGASVWLWLGGGGLLVALLVIGMLVLARDDDARPEEQQLPGPDQAPEPHTAPLIATPTNIPTSAGAPTGLLEETQPGLSMAGGTISSPSAPSSLRRGATMLMGGSVWWLTVGSGPDAGLRFPLSGEAVTLGTAPDANMVVSEGTVSGLHVMITPVPGGIEVQDLGSTNGTWLDGVQQSAPFVVGAGQVFVCGRCELQVSQG